MGTTRRIDAPILAILSNCVVAGDNLALPTGQLDRKTYEAVNKVLELMGGKWNKKLRVHVFSESPADLLDTVLLTGEITDKKKLFQFFETPDALAERMVALAKIGPNSRVLEPSAGFGRIARAIARHVFQWPQTIVDTLVELDPEKANILAIFGIAEQVLTADFLLCNPYRRQTGNTLGIGVFDAIVMNPPFTRGQDIQHIRHARWFLKPGGVLVAICANGPRQREALMDECEYWENLPAGTFADSGTNVNTALLVMRRSLVGSSEDIARAIVDRAVGL